MAQGEEEEDGRTVIAFGLDTHPMFRSLTRVRQAMECFLTHPNRIKITRLTFHEKKEEQEPK